MNINVSIIRAFTDNVIPTLGNPAGVVMTDKMLNASEMRTIAIAAKQPMTAFIIPRATSQNELDIRYYDLNGRECHICGHATIAATAHLVREGLRSGGKNRKISPQSGML